MSDGGVGVLARGHGRWFGYERIEGCLRPGHCRIGHHVDVAGTRRVPSTTTDR